MICAVRTERTDKEAVMMKRLAGRASWPRRVRSWAASLLVALMILAMMPVPAFAAEAGVSGDGDAEAVTDAVQMDDDADEIESGHFFMSLMRTAAMLNGEGAEAASEDSDGDISVAVNIIWEGDDESTRPDSVSVQLVRDGSKVGAPVSVRMDENWRYAWFGLGDNHAYDLYIVDTPNGYTSRITIGSEVSDSGKKYAVCNIINTYVGEILPVDIIIQAMWVGDDVSQRPREMAFDFLRNGSGYMNRSVYGKDDWVGKWEGLDGRYIWNILPRSVPRGYTSSMTVDSKVIDGRKQLVFSITNVYLGIRTTDATARIVWENDSENMRPDGVNVSLLCYDENGYLKSDMQRLTADNDWTYTWTDRDASYFYSVCVGRPPTGYSLAVLMNSSDEGDKPHTIFDIVHTYDDSSTLGMAVHIDWENDDESLRPDSWKFATFQNVFDYRYYRYATPKGDWTVTWPGLKKIDAWSVVPMELLPPGYTSRVATDVSISGSSKKTVTYNITNTYDEPVTTDMVVKAAWADDAESERPEEIKIQLFRNNVAYGSPISLNAGNNWTYTVDGLDNKFVWTACLAGAAPGGYSSTCFISTDVSEDMSKHVACNIENVYTGQTFISSTDLTVRCIWADDDESKRPDRVTVQITRDGFTWSNTLYGPQDWTFTQTYAGCDSCWSVTQNEFPPAGYTVDVVLESEVIDGTKQNVVCTIVYTYVGDSADVDVVVDMSWIEDYTYNRPDDVEIQLMCDGADYSWRVKSLDEACDWTHTWTDLDGRYSWEIRLTDILESYDTEIIKETQSVENDGVISTQNVFHVINTPKTPVPETASVIATVVWSDRDPGSRPDSVRVKLICDGEDYDGEDAVAYLTADNDWTYEWPELDGKHEWSAHTVDPPHEGYTTSHATKAYSLDAGEGLHGYVVCNISNAHEDVMEFLYDDRWGDLIGSYVDAFAVKKVWFGGDEKRLDSVGVALVDSSENSREDVVLNGDSWWNYIWYGIGTSYESLSIEEKTPDPYISKVMYNGTACVVANIPGIADVSDGGFALPDTGGIGTGNLILIGSVLALASLLVLAADRRKVRG